MNITGILFGLFTLLAIRLALVRVILVFFVPSLLVASNLTLASLFGRYTQGTALRLAIDAAVEGLPVAEKAKEHPELARALALWGEG